MKSVGSYFGYFTKKGSVFQNNLGSEARLNETKGQKRLDSLYMDLDHKRLCTNVLKKTINRYSYCVVALTGITVVCTYK